MSSKMMLMANSLTRLVPQPPDLIKWVKNEGGFVHKSIKIAQERDSFGLGLVATEDIPKGSDIIALPQHIPLKFGSENSVDVDGAHSVLIKLAQHVPGVPGSFHGRLLPTRSIHFAHSSCTIHWLSKCPEELLDDKSPAWNKGLIHYIGASNIEVVNAYVAQFEKDMEMFFTARAEEIVPGRMMVLVSPFSGYIRLMRFFASSLMDLVNEGMLDESLVDSFNLPMYFPSPEDMTKVVERNGCFSIEIIELTYPKSKLMDESDAKTLMINLRSSLEGFLINYFGSKIAEEACARTILKSEEISA